MAGRAACLARCCVLACCVASSLQFAVQHHERASKCCSRPFSGELRATAVCIPLRTAESRRAILPATARVPCLRIIRLCRQSEQKQIPASFRLLLTGLRYLAAVSSHLKHPSTPHLRAFPSDIFRRPACRATRPVRYSADGWSRRALKL